MAEFDWDKPASQATSDFAWDKPVSKSSIAEGLTVAGKSALEATPGALGGLGGAELGAGLGAMTDHLPQ